MPSPPLSDVRVLDLSRLVAGNQLTMLLGDFGATVLKIERPGVGDPLRSWLTGGLDLDWKVYARNKRSIELDLKDAADRGRLLALAESAHVLVESFRPGNLEQLGLGPDTLWARNERLVIARVSGWGQTGSYAAKPAFGTLVEALTGFAEANGFPDREPVLPPTALADMIAGTYGAFGVLLALRHAEASGRGQIVDVSLFESLFSTLGPTAAMFSLCGERFTRLGNRSPTTAPRNLYKTSDGKWIALSASAQSMAERLFHAIGRGDLVDDPRFRDNNARVKNVEALDEVLNAYFGSRTGDEAVAEMDRAGVTAGPVAEVGELLESEFFRSREVVISVPDEAGVAVPMHNVVPRLSATPGVVHTAGPPLGRQDREPWPVRAEGSRRERAHSERSEPGLPARPWNLRELAAPPYWRSTLMVPASSRRFLERAHTRGADAILLDLEDGVAPGEKDEARRELPNAIRLVRRGTADIRVRINEAWELAERDLDAALQPEVMAIDLPKVTSAEQVRIVSDTILAISDKRGLDRPPWLVLTIESPVTDAALDSICSSSPLTMAIELGTEDFSEVLHVDPASEVLLSVHSSIVLAGRRGGLLPMGLLGSLANFADEAAFRQLCRRSRRFGYVGASGIHPVQVPILNEEFAPDDEEVARAREVVDAFERAVAEGHGATQLNGSMIDQPVARRARSVLHLAERLESELRRRHRGAGQEALRDQPGEGAESSPMRQTSVGTSEEPLGRSTTGPADRG